MSVSKPSRQVLDDFVAKQSWKTTSLFEPVPKVNSTTRFPACCVVRFTVDG